LNLFQLNQESVDLCPSLGLIILHFEHLLPGKLLMLVVKLVTRFISTAPMHTFESVTRTFSILDPLYSDFKSQFRDLVGGCIGMDYFDDEFAILSEGCFFKISLAPSFSLLFKRCPNQSCQELRFFHTFCLSCGQIFNVDDDHAKSVELKRLYSDVDFSTVGEVNSNRVYVGGRQITISLGRLKYTVKESDMAILRGSYHDKLHY